MSGAQNPLLQGQPAQLPAQQPVQSQPSAAPTTADLVSGGMRGRDPQTMVTRRDAAGPEMEILSRIMNEPNPQPDEAAQYISSLVKAGQMPPQDAMKVIQSMPKDPDALRGWARSMFSAIMHTAVHAHAAFPREVFLAAQQANGAPANNQEPSS